MWRGVFALQQKCRRVSLENLMNLMTPLNHHGFNGVDDTLICQISPEALKRNRMSWDWFMAKDISVQHAGILIH